VKKLKVGEVTVPGASWCGCTNPAKDCTPGKQSGEVVCKRALRGAQTQEKVAEHRLADSAPDTSDFRSSAQPQHLNELPNIARFNPLR
jgi:hypothetical protein